jgi:hypothetical protein
MPPVLFPAGATLRLSPSLISLPCTALVAPKASITNPAACHASCPAPCGTGPARAAVFSKLALTRPRAFKDGYRLPASCPITKWYLTHARMEKPRPKPVHSKWSTSSTGSGCREEQNPPVRGRVFSLDIPFHRTLFLYNQERIYPLISRRRLAVRQYQPACEIP